MSELIVAWWHILPQPWHMTRHHCVHIKQCLHCLMVTVIVTWTLLTDGLWRNKMFILSSIVLTSVISQWLFDGCKYDVYDVTWWHGNYCPCAHTTLMLASGTIIILLFTNSCSIFPPVTSALTMKKLNPETISQLLRLTTAKINHPIWKR